MGAKRPKSLVVIIPICLPAIVVEMRKSLFVEKPQLIENY